MSEFVNGVDVNGSGGGGLSTVHTDGTTIGGDGSTGLPVTALGTVQGTAPIAIAGDNAAHAPIAGLKWTLQRTRASFSGAGPYSISATLVDRVLMTPGSGNASVANLPSIANASVIDGWPVTFSNTGTGADMVVLTPNGTDTIAGAAFYRIFQGGSIILIPDKTTNTWEVAGEVRGYPTTITITVSTSGNANNPGTVASPVSTLAAAMKLADVQWTSSGTISLLSGVFDSGSGLVYFIPGPKPGSGGTALTIQGPSAMKNGVAGVTTVTVTGGSAANTSAFRKVTFASVPAFANNAAQQCFFKGLSGTVNNRTLPVRVSTATSLEFMQSGAALSSGTFSVLIPDASIAGFTMLPGTGRAVTFNNVDLNPNITLNGLIVTLSLCRINSMTFTNCVTTANACIVTDFVNNLGGVAATLSGGIWSGNNIGFLIGLYLQNSVALTLNTFGGDDTPLVNWTPQIISSANGTAELGSSALGHNYINLQTFKFTETNFAVYLDQSDLFVNVGYVNAVTNLFLDDAINLRQSTAVLLGLTGDIGSNATQAVSALDGSKVRVNNTTSITANGAANAVAVGALGVKSWATIAGDVITNTFDGAVNGGSGVSVRLSP